MHRRARARSRSRRRGESAPPSGTPQPRRSAARCQRSWRRSASADQGVGGAAGGRRWAPARRRQTG
ncbi:MAG: hypothetical protein DLM63_11600 [Solirubrobacterales bacterium]|nr:MAG: hypothetical protein DLM63_11600 [Solirubrobacterales bacterium]